MESVADKEYSRYQKQVIKNYYDNREQIDSGRLSELVTSLYLAGEKKAAKMWETAGERHQGSCDSGDGRGRFELGKDSPEVTHTTKVENVGREHFPVQTESSSDRRENVPVVRSTRRAGVPIVQVELLS
jgi:hypothetical protein